MKVRNEVKVGILAVIATILLIWGFNFLKGKNVFSSDIVIYATFKTVDGLNIAAPVTLNGYQIGAVTNIGPTEDYSGVKVEMNVKSDASIPKDALALLVQPSVMGGKQVALIFEGKCEGENCVMSGDKVVGDVAGMLDGVLESADPYLQNVDTLLKKFKELSKDEKGQFNETFQDLRGVVSNLNTMTQLMNVLMAGSTQDINGIMSNLNSITKNIEANNQEITKMISNLSSVTEQFKEADIATTIQSTTTLIENVNKVIGGIQTSLDNVNLVVEDIKQITDLTSQKGLSAALFNDGQLKGDVDVAIENVSKLLEDIRLHPERYRTILSNKYKPYIEPEEK